MDGRKRRAGWWAVWAAGAIVALPALYVLSLGPAVYLVTHGVINKRTIVFVAGMYRPLNPLIGPNGPFHDLSEKYLDLFRKRRPGEGIDATGGEMDAN